MIQNILITGGSSGIGKGIASYFYKKGWRVLITGRDANKLQAVKSEMPGIYTEIYDSLGENQFKAITEFIAGEWNGKLDILVNNAGNVQLSDLKSITKNEMESMYITHLISPSLLASACLDFLEASKGHILNISSSHGIKPYANTSSYGSAKAGLNMLTKIWALELAPKGIRVNAIAPGPTYTEILSANGFSNEMIAEIHKSEAEAIPLQRRGNIEDIVAKAVLLLDSGSTWTTGVILPVDGGLSIS